MANRLSDAHRLTALSAVLAQQERSARWLGIKCGKSASYVTRVLMGERKPSADFKARAAATLNVPEELLFPDVDEAA